MYSILVLSILYKQLGKQKKIKENEREGNGKKVKEDIKKKNN